MSRPNFVDVDATRNCDDLTVNIRVESLSLLAFGVFGNVYAGKLVHPHRQKVVIKKTWSKGHKSMSEVKILKMLNSQNYRNIVQLLYIFTNYYSDGRRCNALVFERMQFTLTQYDKKYRSAVAGGILELVDVKLFTWQLFNAQHHLADHNVCHRDIKPDNIFIDATSGLLKLGDFGSSVILEDGTEADYYQVTRYYRPPELLLGSHHYTTNIDVWSCGCVFGELLRGGTLLRGNSSLQQYEVIVERFGYPTLEDIRAMRCKDKYSKSTMRAAINKAESCRTSPCRSLLPNAPAEAIALLDRILVYNPARRLHGEALLNDSFFDEIFQPNIKRLGDTKNVDFLSAQELKRMTARRNRANVI